jgi:hypothetical protein
VYRTWYALPPLFVMLSCHSPPNVCCALSLDGCSTNGNCKGFGPDVVYRDGSQGVITAVLTPATSAKPEQIDILFNYKWASCTVPGEYCMTHFTCFNVGRSAEADGSTKCEHSTYFYTMRSHPVTGYEQLFNSAPSFSASEAAQYMKRNAIRVTAKGVLVVRDYYDTYGSVMVNTVRHIRGTFAADAFINPSYMADSTCSTHTLPLPLPLPLGGASTSHQQLTRDVMYVWCVCAGDYVKELRPDMAAILSSASTKVLTTQQIIQKFFTADNIDLARMQGMSVCRVLYCVALACCASLCVRDVCAACVCCRFLCAGEGCDRRVQHRLL